MNNKRIDAAFSTNIWRTAQRRRATYLATLIDEPTDDARYAMAKRSAIPAVLASALVAVAVWALA